VKAVLVCFIVCLVACGVSSSFFPDIPSPVFFWSGSNYFTAKNTQILGSTSTNEITNFLLSILTKTDTTSKLSGYKNGEVAPELVIMWIVTSEEFHSHSYKQIQPLIESSTSSIIFPYNYHHNSIPSASIVNNVIRAGEKVIIAQDDVITESEDLINIQKKDLVSYLENNKNLFTNGKSDLLIVYLPTGSVDFISKVEQAVKELSHGNYVAVLTADSPVVRITETVTAVHTQIAVMQRDMWHFAQADFWPIQVWEGLMISLLLIFMLIIGVGCTATVQTPQRWGTGKYNCQFTEIPDP